MQATKQQIEDILQTIRLYEQGHAANDFEMLEQAFHPKACVVGHYDGEMMFAQRDEYLEILRDDPEPDPKGDQPELKVRSMDVVGDTAVVTVESIMVGTKFTSHLSLIQNGARWQIVNGLFYASPPNQ